MSNQEVVLLCGLAALLLHFFSLRLKRVVTRLRHQCEVTALTDPKSTVLLIKQAYQGSRRPHSMSYLGGIVLIER